jgi:acyl-CoA thioesterase-2
MPENNTAALTRLIKQLELDRLDRDLFLGDPGPGEWRLFGGLVAAQSVMAAYRTVEEGALHSLHAYFLRPGKHGVPIRYVVYRIRDGRSFTTRDVVAYQSGEAIFNLSSSFVKPEEGITHQEPMPDLPGPEGLPQWEFARPDRPEDAAMMRRMNRHDVIEMRSIDRFGEQPPGLTPRRRVWMRVRGVLPEDPALHAAMITYASDRGLIATARFAHGDAGRRGVPRDMRSSASLDHALWFHRPPRFDDWLLFTSESPVAHAARALILGQMYRTDGTRIASVVQEGLIRGPRPSPQA